MESTNFAERSVTREPEGGYKVQRILVQAAYLLFPFIILIVCVLINIYLFMVGVLLILLYINLLGKLIKPLTWCYFNYDYYYCIKLGVMKVEKVYTQAKRKVLVEKKISEFEKIAPYKDEYKAAADDPSIARRYEAVSTMKAGEIYYATFTDKDGKKAVVFFEPTKDAVRLLSFYNHDTVVTHVSM